MAKDCWWHPIAGVTQLLHETEILFAHSKKVLGVATRTLYVYRDVGLAVKTPDPKYARKARKNWPKVKLECYAKSGRRWCTTVEAWERFTVRLNGGEA